MNACVALVLLALCASAEESRSDDPLLIHVVVWDERQPEQKEGYDGGFLGDHIAAGLAKLPGLTVESVGLDDPEQGLPAERIDKADVLIWWSHIRDGEFDGKKALRIAKRVQEGKLALIVLHSGFAGRPFQRAIGQRVADDATKAATALYPRTLAPLEGTTTTFRLPEVDYEFRITDAYVPDHKFDVTRPGYIEVFVRLPAFSIAGYREDAKPSHVTVLRPDHPIATGLPEAFDIPQTEMYAEPFHVPEPDLVILEETWVTGEKFRSGCLWRLGNGYVFYFRPGHETYPVYKNREPMKILENAIRFMAAPKQAANS